MPGDASTPAADPPQNADRPPIDVALPDRTTPALVSSLVFHLIVLIVLGLALSRVPKGSGDSADRPVGIAMVHQLPDRERYVDAADTPPPTPDQTEATTTASAAAAAAPPADLSPPIDLNGILQAMEATPAPTSGTGLAGETSLQGDAFDNDSGSSPSADPGETTATVFGVSGSGSRFVYVFDRSDSMNGFDGKPLRAAKSELLRSLKTLGERQRFQIVFYNDKPTPFRVAGMPLQLIAGEGDLIARAQRYVGSVTAFGGTEHASAIKLALRMSPDVIFFLTDARIPRLSAGELREIRDLAARGGTAIHTIEFGAEPLAPADSFLRDLAAMNQGQYQYLDVRQLGRSSAKEEQTQAAGQQNPSEDQP